MQSLKSLCLLVLTLTFCASSGCDVTLGPKTRQVYTIVHPGRPLQIVKNQVVTGRILEGGGTEAPVLQDVGGWIVMPEEHFRALVKAARMSEIPALKQSEIK
jgi:hypothetical protein